LARARCGDPCPGGGDCFAANATPACDDETCCTTVCGVDPYCCEVSWDQMCADLAAARCTSACRVAIPPDAVIEPEACGSDSNGGCNSTPPRYGVAECGTTIAGTAWSNAGVRDTDWFLVQATDGCTRLRALLTSEFPGVSYIVGGIEGCAPELLSDPGDSNFCSSGSDAAALVGPGTYVVYVSTAGYDTFPCGTRNGYVVSVVCGECE
jgi:hypothetical protein